MANREKGETALVVGERHYTLVHNHHAIALFQYHFTQGEKVADIFLLDKFVREGSLIHQEALLWAMLQKHHAKDVPTVLQASDLIDADAHACGVALRQALGYAAPDEKDAEELSAANPPKAQPKKKRRTNGTGASASSVRVA